jgi:hypothetical protein
MAFDRVSVRRAASLGCAAAVFVASAIAWAGGSDGAYGRLEGDVTLVAGVGGEVVATPRRWLGTAELRARYLDAAGVVVSYQEGDAFGRATSYGELRRGFGAGVEIRPLFPVRFLKNFETGGGFADLVLDSFGLEMQAWWSAQEGSAVSRPGLSLGLGVEVPFAPHATGVWLRISPQVRWTAPRLEGDPVEGSRMFVLSIGLAWHQVVDAHIVDAGDRRVE